MVTTIHLGAARSLGVPSELGVGTVWELIKRVSASCTRDAARSTLLIGACIVYACGDWFLEETERTMLWSRTLSRFHGRPDSCT